MNKHKLFNLVLAFVFSFSLGGLPRTSVFAEESSPYIQAFPDQDRVNANDWPMDTVITMTINGSYTYTSRAGQSSWDPDGTTAGFDIRSYGLKAGDSISMTGGGITRGMIVTTLRITNIDVISSTVSGTADTDKQVFVWVNGAGGMWITPNPDGTWSADFAPFSFVPGTEGGATQPDSGGNTTQIGWHTLNPVIQAFPDQDKVNANDWPIGTEISMTINGSSTYTAKVAASSWDPYGTTAEIRVEDHDIQAGDEISITGADITRSMTVTSLQITNIDVSSGTVSGIADADKIFHVWVNGGSDFYIAPDIDGKWTANFSPFVFVYDTNGGAQQTDEFGNYTQVDWRLPNSRIFALLEDQRVHAWGWPAGTRLELLIDNPATPQSPDYIGTQEATAFEDWDHGADWGITYDIQPGYRITVSGGGIKKELDVAPLTVTNVDMEADTVSGTGDPGFEIHVGMLCDDNGCTRRNVYVDSNGIWLADFSVPGADDDETVFDIRPGSGTGVYQIDEDNDATNVGWNLPYPPAFQVRANGDGVDGWEWPLGETVTIEVNDPSTPDDIDYSGTATVGVADWDPNQTWFSVITNNYDLKAGDTVTVKDENITKHLLVTDFRITNVDLDTDRVYGKAEPGQHVNIWTCWHDIPCVNRDETANANGDWFTDFSVPGEQDWEQETADLQTESWIDSSVSDDDGDQVVSGWYVYAYTLHAVPTHPEVHGHDWPTGANVTLIIDDDNDPNNGVLYTLTKNADDDPWCGYPCFDLAGAFELEVGQYVTMTDGVVSRTVQVSVLQITEVDRENDIVSGIADPGSRVAVNIWSQDGLARYVTTGEDGTWVADFSVFGDEDFEQFTTDISYGDNGRAIQLNPDGTDDGTLEYWNLDWIAPDTVPLVVALNSDVNLDRPEYTIETWTVTNLLWEPLFKLSPQNEPIPAAATGYVFSPDRKTITITLRDDLSWSDGQPVTAQHYVDGFKRLLAPDTTTEYGFLLFDIVGAEEYNADTASDVSGLVALNDTTLQITLKAPAVYYPAVLSDPGMIPARMDLIAQYGDAWISPQNFVGNGPYNFLEHDRGHLLLAKNPLYHDAANVAFGQIGFDIIPDQNEQFEAYKRGDVDVLIDAPQSALDDPNFVLGREFSDAPGIFFLGLNTQRAPTDDPKVRKALASAIDRRALLDNVLNMPWLQDATGVIPPELLGYQGDAVGFDYDPAYAQSLLAEAGYPNGVGLPTIHLYGNDTTLTHQILEEVAQQWRTVLNIFVETHYLADFNQWVRACEEDPGACPYNGIRQGWGVDYFDPHNILNDLFYPDSGQAKRLGWDDPRYRELIDLSRGEQDPAQRLAYIHEAEQILVEDDAAVIPLYFAKRVSLIKPGYETAYGIVPYFEQWDWISINQPPDANAGPDQIVFAGERITLDASTSSDPDADPLTYAWDLDNDGQYDDANSVIATTSFYQPGNHVISLQVTDEGGLSATDTVTVVVLAWINLWI
jgi:oligopeptide transport system substrate-binding protein